MSSDMSAKLCSKICALSDQVNLTSEQLKKTRTAAERVERNQKKMRKGVELRLDTAEKGIARINDTLAGLASAIDAQTQFLISQNVGQNALPQWNALQQTRRCETPPPTSPRQPTAPLRNGEQGSVAFADDSDTDEDGFPWSLTPGHLRPPNGPPSPYSPPHSPTSPTYSPPHSQSYHPTLPNADDAAAAGI